MSCNMNSQKKGMCNSYRNISSFGSNNSPNNDPITYCLFGDVDKTLSHNPLGYSYSPDSRECQIYTGDYCSKDGNWENGVCQLLYSNQREILPQTGSVTKYSGYSPNAGNILNGNVPYGKQLLRNSAQRRFLDLTGCPYTEYPFDPTVASSPMIKDYLTFYGKQFNNNSINGNVCRGQRCSGMANMSNLDPSKVDSDPLLNEVLNNIPICMDILKSIAITIKLNNKLNDYKGTRLGKFCEQYFASF